MTLTDVSTTPKMTSAQVVETSVIVISNSPSQDYTHPDDRTLLYDMTPGFKPFTIIYILYTINYYIFSGVASLCLVKINCFNLGLKYFYLTSQSNSLHLPPMQCH